MWMFFFMKMKLSKHLVLIFGWYKLYSYFYEIYCVLIIKHLYIYIFLYKEKGNKVCANNNFIRVVWFSLACFCGRSSVSDISSRHPVILGYRNIIKACFRYDVHTITLPLLLAHEMVEVGAKAQLKKLDSLFYR